MSSQLKEIMHGEDPEQLIEWIDQGNDPSEDGNWAIRYARKHELKTMVSILMDDRRVAEYKGASPQTGRLPIHVVEEIINRVYDTQGSLGLFELVPRIQNTL